MTTLLFDKLIDFRGHSFAVTADISKAFHRVGVASEDRQYLKFLTYERDQLQCYQFTVVSFGATYSPYLLQYTLHHHFKQHEHPLALKLSSCFYVDNYLHMDDSEKLLIKQKGEVEKILMDASMPLQGWVSNSQQFNQMFGNAEDLKETCSILGLMWDAEQTHYTFKLRVNLANGKTSP